MKTKNITISGMIEKVYFRNDTGWATFKLIESATQKNFQCTGILSEMVTDGSDVICEGELIHDKKWGKQFKCLIVTPVEIKPDSAMGVSRLLASLPGIGRTLAAKAITNYGYKEAWEIAQTYPSVLGIYKVETAIKARNKAISLNSSVDFKARSYFLSLGLTDHQINKILKASKNAVHDFKDNPYKLIDVEGFGFLTVDKFALKAKINANHPARIKACLLYCLNSSEKNEGNIYLYGKYLIKIVLETLKASALKNNNPTVTFPDYQTVKTELLKLEQEKKVFIDHAKVYSFKLLNAEKEIEQKIKGEIGK